MKLSKEAKEYVEAQFEKEIDNARYKLKLLYESVDSTPVALLRKPDKFIERYFEYIEELVKDRVSIFIQAYKREKKIIDQTEFNELMDDIYELIETQGNYLSDGPDFASDHHNQLITDRLEEIEAKFLEKSSYAQREYNFAMKEMQIQEKERIRDVLLNKIYDILNGSEIRMTSFYDVAKEEGIIGIDATEHLNNLESQNLIKVRSDEGYVSMTLEGNMHVQKLNKRGRRNPKQPTISKAPITEPIHRDFTFIADTQIQAIIERDYAELYALDPNKAAKSVLVLSGGIIEGLLIDAIITSGIWDFEECRSRQLKDIIYRAKTDGIIAHDNIAEVVKTFRNLIHPAREIKDSLAFNNSHAVQSRAAVDVIIDDVRKWYAARS